MVDAQIALNRFGLGARSDDGAPADPRKWLLKQLDAFDARPAPIGALPGGRAVAAELVEAREQLKALQQSTPRPAAGRTRAKRGGSTAAPIAAPDAMAAGVRSPGGGGADAVKEARRRQRQRGQALYADAVGARAEAALVSPAPFVERLVHFWANHFAISVDKPQVVALGGFLEFDAIRPHVLGRFGDMLAAVERHPAMLLYLDQTQSVGPDSPVGARVARRGRRSPGLNENLAREIMELHTLGVRSGYDQADVTEFARALTGWTVAGLGRNLPAGLDADEGRAGDFTFVAALHQPGVRTIMGKSYGQAGVAQAQAVLDDLAAHPATAGHVATKLARHFAEDTPPPALVERLRAAFLQSAGDLPTLYRVLIESPEAWASQPAKFKTPWEWSISAYRAIGMRTAPAPQVTGLLKQLGQTVWNPGSPAGFDDIAASWAGPDAILRRVEAAARFGARSASAVDARTLAPRLFPTALSAATSQALARAESPAQALTLLLVAPEFMRR